MLKMKKKESSWETHFLNLSKKVVKNYGLSWNFFEALRMRGIKKENSCCKTRFLIFVSGQELQRKLKDFEALRMRGMKKENSCW